MVVEGVELHAMLVLRNGSTPYGDIATMSPQPTLEWTSKRGGGGAAMRPWQVPSWLRATNNMEVPATNSSVQLAYTLDLVLLKKGQEEAKNMVP